MAVRGIERTNAFGGRALGLTGTPRKIGRSESEVPMREVCASEVTYFIPKTSRLSLCNKRPPVTNGVTRSELALKSAGVARNAVRFFADPYWRGPKSGPGANLNIRELRS